MNLELELERLRDWIDYEDYKGILIESLARITGVEPIECDYTATPRERMVIHESGGVRLYEEVVEEHVICRGSRAMAKARRRVLELGDTTLIKPLEVEIALLELEI